MKTDITLLIPEKTDPETEEVFSSFTKKGGTIKRLGKYWVKDEQLASQNLAIYGNQAFALVLAQIYNLELVSPDDALIARLDTKWTKRNILKLKIEELDNTRFPAFAKPVIPKLFLAGIFDTFASFKQVTEGLDKQEEILVSNIISITAEARSYLKDGEIKDIALYEGQANMGEARVFLNEFINHHKEQLPSVVVIDLDYSDDDGWFILEFNACWGAGLNNCRAEKVIECILNATKKA